MLSLPIMFADFPSLRLSAFAFYRLFTDDNQLA